MPGYSRLPLTVAAQRVQRSGYPQAYAKHEPDAALLAAALTGRAPAALTCDGPRRRRRHGRAVRTQVRAALVRDFGRGRAARAARRADPRRPEGVSLRDAAAGARPGELGRVTATGARGRRRPRRTAAARLGAGALGGGELLRAAHRRGLVRGPASGIAGGRGRRKWRAADGGGRAVDAERSPAT